MSAATRSTGTGPPLRSARLRRRLLASATAALTVAGLLGAGSSGPAAAAGGLSTVGSALAQSTAVTPGTGLTFTTVSSTGLLGALTNSITVGIINAAATLPNAILTSVTGSLNSGAGLSAANLSTQQPRPAPVANYPTCGQQGWTASVNCFSVINGNPSAPTLAAGVLVGASAGTVQGYATGDDQGFVGAAGSSHPMIAVPGLVIDLGVASSNSQCTTAQVCTPNHSFSGASVTTVSGTQSLALATGSALASVGNTTIANNATVPIVGNAITATANGNLLTFNVALSLTSFLSALGTSLSILGSGLTQGLSDNGSSITLAVTLGPGDIASSSTQASAWGLEVGVNLVADLKFNATSLLGGLLGGLVGSTELKTVNAANYPTVTGSEPDLLDLEFAYSQANAGVLLSAFVPPAVI